jgi:mono/diheme cytochrome c family protein
MKIVTFFSLFLIILYSSCAWNNEEEQYGNEICDTSDVTYKNDIKPIFQENCYSCHGPGAVGTYSGDLLQLENFVHIQRVVDDGKLLRNIKHEQGGIPMPYGGAKISECKINKIENWINQGYPQN